MSAHRPSSFPQTQNDFDGLDNGTDSAASPSPPDTEVEIDEDEYWRGADAAFSQHAEVLTQFGGEYSENEEDDGDDDDDDEGDGGCGADDEDFRLCVVEVGQDGTASDQTSSDTLPKNNTNAAGKKSANEKIGSEYDEFPFLAEESNDFEASQLAAAAELQSQTPLKRKSSFNEDIGTSTFQIDKEAMSARSSMEKKTPSNPKKRRASCESVSSTKNRCFPKNKTPVQKNTLTQMMKKKKAEPDIDVNPCKIIQYEWTNKNECTVNGRFFQTGQVFQSSEIKDKGYAFTLGEFPRPVNGLYMVEISHVWLRLENAFIGPHMASQVLRQVGKEWVLVKKHDKLLKDGNLRLQLRFLKRQVYGDFDESRALLYKRGGDMDHAFYYECAEQLDMPPEESRPITLDLYAGGGGASLGLKEEGFDGKYKLDMNSVACETLMANFYPNSFIFCEDIRNFIESCKSERPGYPKRGELDHIHGSPPCQGFCPANTGGGICDEQNNQCTLEFLDAVTLLEPTFVSMENVPGLTHGENIVFLQRVVGGLLASSYQVRLFLCCAKDFGDPQDRKRMILLAAKKGYILPAVPKATHGTGLQQNIVTSEDALKDLEDVEPVPMVAGYAMVQIPSSGRIVEDHSVYGTTFSRKHDKAYRLNAHLPAKTVMKGHPIKHYKNQRYLTIRERARLQSFPDNFRFMGAPQDRKDQIGNAVPVCLARAIAKVVMESYRIGRHQI